MNNRQIKFRVWDKTKKLMSPVARIMYADDGYAKTIMVEAVPYDSNYYRAVVDGENGELLQFTGAKDKNHKDIYEGDLLKISDKDRPDYFKDYCHVWYSDSGCFVVSFNHLYSETSCELSRVYYQYEIIGNIFENPELLK